MTTTTAVLHTEAANDEISLTQIDQATLDQHLAHLKALDLSDAAVNVYVVKISTDNIKKRFQSVMRLPCEDTLNARFKGYAKKYITDYTHISELRDIHTSQDNRFFFVESTATDFQQVIDIIDAEQSPRPINNETDLNTFNGYVIKLTITNEEGLDTNLYAFRYISKAWSVKNSASWTLKLKTLQNQLVADLDTEPRFTITSCIDLIQVGDSIFIANIDQFEKAMNYRKRLQERKNEAISALAAGSALVDDGSEVLSRVIGTDKHLMRQLASVHSKPYYNNNAWLIKLKQAAEKPESSHWLIKYDDQEKIQV